MERICQVIIQDEYNNLYELGWFKDLDCQELYDAINDNLGLTGKWMLKKGDLCEYASTFGFCFDTTIADILSYREDVSEEELEDNYELYSTMIRGFSHNKKELIDFLERM